jgi:AbiV family abortive infection protein
MTPLTSEVLIRGAMYALEQAWFLLQDAVLLIQRKRHASSVVLATYCLEQLGRAQVYREKAKDAEGGSIVTLEMMKSELREHLPKLSKAEIPVTASIFRVAEPPAPGTEAERRLGEQLVAVRKSLESTAPRRASQIRMRALHVDHIERPPDWNRPSQVITRDDSDNWVGAATLRYSTLRSDLSNSSSAVDRRIWAGVERLEIPEASWGIWTWEAENAVRPKAADSK